MNSRGLISMCPKLSGKYCWHHVVDMSSRVTDVTWFEDITNQVTSVHNSVLSHVLTGWVSCWYAECPPGKQNQLSVVPTSNMHLAFHFWQHQHDTEASLTMADNRRFRQNSNSNDDSLVCIWQVSTFLSSTINQHALINLLLFNDVSLVISSPYNAAN